MSLIKEVLKKSGQKPVSEVDEYSNDFIFFFIDLPPPLDAVDFATSHNGLAQLT